MANPNQEARNSFGHYVRTPESAQRDADAATLRSRGYTYSMIAQRLGYPSTRAASDGVARVLREIPREAAEDLLAVELDRLDAELRRLDGYEEAVRVVLERHHVTVNNGHIIIDPRTDDALLDDGPVLQAVRELLRIEAARDRNGERRARLLGLDAPKRMEVLTIDAIDAAIADLNQQLAAVDLETGTPEGAEGTPG